MYVPKGYRARERAAKERKVRGRMPEHIRLQRAANLEANIAAAIEAAKDKHERSEGYVNEAVMPVVDTEPVAPVAEPQAEPVASGDAVASEETIFETDEAETAGVGDAQPVATTEEKPAAAEPKSVQKKKK